MYGPGGVKYLVKNLVESTVSTGPSGVVCSTPLVGRRERKDVNPSILARELIQSGRKELQGNDKLVERFVYKYFYIVCFFKQINVIYIYIFATYYGNHIRFWSGPQKVGSRL